MSIDHEQKQQKMKSFYKKGLKADSIITLLANIIHPLIDIAKIQDLSFSREQNTRLNKKRYG